MKTIGLLGGMSWVSTSFYYDAINRLVAERLGGLHSARLILLSVDFAEIERFQRAQRWDAAAELLVDAARRLELAGADILVLCTNTMHRVARELERALTIPFLHIGDATARRVRAAGIARVGLLGTKFTMELDFYRGRLERGGLQVVVPDAADRELVHRVIYDELCLNQRHETSREEYRRIASGLVTAGAEGVIFGCTEIGMLLDPHDVSVPTFDTTRIHAEEAVRLALA
jgi:aspartate racemase